MAEVEIRAVSKAFKKTQAVKPRQRKVSDHHVRALFGGTQQRIGAIRDW